jgi:hypothetical protein
MSRMRLERRHQVDTDLSDPKRVGHKDLIVTPMLIVAVC